MICCRKGCATAPSKIVILSFSAIGHSPYMRAVGETGLVVCDEHTNELRVSDLVTDESWQRICDGMRAMGRAQPDRDSIQLDFKPIQ